MKLATKIIHEDNVKHESGAVISPIVMSTTFERNDDGLTFPDEFIYGRYDNPNRHALESKLTKMEGGAACVAFSSGMAAANAIFQNLKPGDHVVLADDTYFSIRKLLQVMFGPMGITCSLADFTDLEAIKNAIKPNTVCLWMESPSNPMIKVTDIEQVVNIAKENNCFTVADNTWATPFYTNPCMLGVDITLHSTTKYLGGHSDLLSGALVFKEENEFYTSVRLTQKIGGAVPSPFDCWLLCRSLTSFAARMPIHSSNALALATFIESREEIERVFYPGLPSHPQHSVALKQMKGGYGGMLSIFVKGGQTMALRLCCELKLFTHATSLGGVESLIEHRKSIEGDTSKTPDNLLRISVGIEDVEDLVEDFREALGRI